MDRDEALKKAKATRKRHVRLIYEVKSTPFHESRAIAAEVILSNHPDYNSVRLQYLLTSVPAWGHGKVGKLRREADAMNHYPRRGSKRKKSLRVKDLNVKQRMALASTIRGKKVRIRPTGTLDYTEEAA